MATIHTIREKLVKQEYEFTIPHFFEEMANENLIFADIEMAIANGRIRRKFTRDPRGTRHGKTIVYYNLHFGGNKMKTKKTRYDYGECEICNTPMQERCIKQYFWIRGELIVVEDVPAGVCPQCGKKVVKADVGRWITKLIENSEWIAKAPRISVPAIKFVATASKSTSSKRRVNT